MLQKAKETVLFFLKQMGCIDSASSSQIKDAVNNALKIYPVNEDTLKREIESMYRIWVDEFRIIEKAEARRPWLMASKANIKWNFWERYRNYLEEYITLPQASVKSIDDLTDRVLDALFNPKIKAVIDKRGMVVGQVQSGKTANYVGLICKAADAGFGIIVILAGIHNNLRSQTQLRVDLGFLGFDTQHERAFRDNNLWIGVGKDPKTRKLVAHSLTSNDERGDFTASATRAMGLNFNTEQPIIAVVKKNARVLERIEQWLTAFTESVSDGRKVIRNKTLLLIDDEADHASINTRRDELNPTKINNQIRKILKLFDKSGYVGYTATPFANIFIPLDDDNLFPRDFIINLQAPSNYIGPDKIFGLKPYENDDDNSERFPIIFQVDDFEEFFPNRHKKDDDLPESLPDSLKTAIRCFIITCAVRRLRNQKEVHNSMLIHVTRFQRWQRHIKYLVSNVFNLYRMGIEQKIPLIINLFENTFKDDSGTYRSYISITRDILDSELSDFDTCTLEHSWVDVAEHLHDAASRIQIKEIHGGAADSLSYFDHKEGLSVIVVGGNKLSRGLTLEGLSVSYFLRASKMYDTLMQMGRWFGYRPGYIDLCRLFTSAELNEWFSHIALASEELRNEFEYMSDVAGSTPEQYALRVRTHPGVLQISASNKIRNAVTVHITWAGRLVQTYRLQKNHEIIESNYNITRDFIISLKEQYQSKSHSYVWYNIDIELIRIFLKGFQIAEDLISSAPVNLLRYIDGLGTGHELQKWRVAVKSKRNTGKRSIIMDFDIGWLLRSQADDNKNTYHIRKSNITSRQDEFIDMTEEEISYYYQKTVEQWRRINRKGKPVNPDPQIVRNEYRKPDKPLLIIYFLDPAGAELPQEAYPIIGFAISFPASHANESVSYAVHEQFRTYFDFYLDEYDDEVNDE